MTIKKGKCVNLNWFNKGEVNKLDETTNYILYKRFYEGEIMLLYFDKLNTYIFAEFSNVKDKEKATKAFNDEVIIETLKNGW